MCNNFFIISNYCNLHWVEKIYFAVLEEIYNNVGKQF